MTSLKTDEQILFENGLSFDGPASNHPYPISQNNAFVFQRTLREERIFEYEAGQGVCAGRQSNLGVRLTMEGGRIALVFANATLHAAAAGIATGIASGSVVVATPSSVALGGGIGAGAGHSIGGTLSTALSSPLTIGLAGIGIGLTIWSIFKSHHTQAVARERGLLCAYVPAFNDAISKIEDAVISGRILPSQGISILQQLQLEFENDVTPIMKKNIGQCNAACIVTLQAQIIITKKVNRYQILAENQINKKQKQNLLLGGGIIYGTAKILGLI